MEDATFMAAGFVVGMIFMACCILLFTLNRSDPSENL